MTQYTTKTIQGFVIPAKYETLEQYAEYITSEHQRAVKAKLYTMASQYYSKLLRLYNAGVIPNLPNQIIL
jgi:hypothetical protein